MTTAVLAGGLALVLSLLLTPVARRLAIALGMTDTPGGRRIHLTPIPRGGGIAVAVAAAIACGVCVGMPTGLGRSAVLGALLLLVVGLADDALSLRPHTKLFGQLVAAILAASGGLRLSLLDPTGIGGVLGLGDAAITVFWIVLITNAVNLTDGLDGLAAGVGAIACWWLACIGLRGGDPTLAVAPLVMAGALLGFLAYNFNPATIFLGDTGSLLIGYTMAVLPLAGMSESSTPPLAAALLVAVPATDTMLAIARRFVSRCVTAWGEGLFWRGLIDGLKNTVAPDRRHVHHRLLDLGFTQRRAVLLLYLAAATTGALSYVVAESPGWPVDLFAVGLGLSVVAIVQALGFDELQPVRSGLFLPLLRRVASHRWVIVGLDAVIVAVVYGGMLLLSGRSLVTPAFAAATTIMAVIQLAAFVSLGVYRMAWRATGIGGFGLLIRATIFGAVCGYIVLRVLHLPVSGTIVLCYFFLLLSAVTLVRFSYVLLSQAALRAAPAEPALICGTAQGAREALGRLRRAGLLDLKPVGLVEVRPRWQGRRLDQLPVVGSLDALRTLIRQEEARHLVIADPTIRGESLAWVRAVCRAHGVKLHRYVERFVSHDELVQRLRTVTDMTTAWTVLGQVFSDMRLDGCVLPVGAKQDDDPQPQREACRYVPGTSGDESSALRDCLRDGWEGVAEMLPHFTVNGSGDGNGSTSGQGRTRTELTSRGWGMARKATVLRHDGERWRSLVTGMPEAEDVIALPIGRGKTVWGVLLAKPQGIDRLLTRAERIRLSRVADVLGRRVARLGLTRGSSRSFVQMM